jgi:hypothetical protein
MTDCYCVFRTPEDCGAAITEENLLAILERKPNEILQNPCQRAIYWAINRRLGLHVTPEDTFIGLCNNLKVLTRRPFTFKEIREYYTDTIGSLIYEILVREGISSGRIKTDLYSSQDLDRRYFNSDQEFSETVLNILWSMLAQIHAQGENEVSFSAPDYRDKFRVRKTIEPDIMHVTRLYFNRHTTPDVLLLLRLREAERERPFVIPEMFYDSTLLCQSKTHLFGATLKEAREIAEDYRRDHDLGEYPTCSGSRILIFDEEIESSDGDAIYDFDDY